MRLFAPAGLIHDVRDIKDAVTATALHTGPVCGDQPAFNPAKAAFHLRISRAGNTYTHTHTHTHIHPDQRDDWLMWMTMRVDAVCRGPVCDGHTSQC